MKALVTSPGWFLFASLVALPCARATTYDLTWSPAFIEHYDVYELLYDPTGGWTTKAMWGENNDWPGSFLVSASDGSVGRNITAVITVRGSIHGEYEYNYGMYDYDPAIAPNYGGMSAGTLEGKVTVFTTGGIVPDHTVSGAFPFGSGYEFKFKIATQVGTQETFGISTSHPAVVPTGLYAIDPTKPAAHTVFLDLTSNITDVSFALAPDATSTLFLLAMPLVGLAGYFTWLTGRSRDTRAIPESSR